MRAGDGQTPRILVVDDNPGDLELTQEALAESGVPHLLDVAHDGEEALAFLRREGEHGAARRPDLVLLDLNLPRIHGREVLAALRADPELRRMPVVFFTSSSAADDIAEIFELGANAYVAKPVDYKDFQRAVRAIAEFWLVVADLPPRRRRPRRAI